MTTGDTTREEIADLVFNSEDPELNDMMLAAKEHNYEIDQLIFRVMADINGHFGPQLHATRPVERKPFLIRKIKSEMNYYAHWWERKKD